MAADIAALAHPRRRAAQGPPSIWRNFAWTFAGNMVYAGCQWGMLIVVAKLGSPEMVGRFALGLAITAPVFMLANLQLRAVQATDARREYRFGDYLALRLITTAIASAAIVAITSACGYDAATARVILAVGLAKGFESISDVYYGRLQGSERMDRIAYSMMIKGPLSLAAFGAALACTGDIACAALALAGAWALVLFGFDIPTGIAAARSADDGPEGNRPRWQGQTLGKLAWLTLPMGTVMMLISFQANIPRYVIEQRLGNRELGIYAAIGYLMVAASTVVSALGQSASPRLARAFAQGALGEFRVDLARLLRLSAWGGAIAVGSVALFGRTLLATLYTPDYAHHRGVFLVLTIAAAIGAAASMLGYAMTATRRLRQQAPLFGGVAVVSAVSAALLVPGLGLLGAAIASVITTSAQLIGSAFIVKKALDLRRGETA